MPEKDRCITLNTVRIFDSTLRDGAQAEGISFSVEDKLRIVAALDDLGVSYIEAGNPFSNPKDLKFFEQIEKIKLKNAKIAAFGSTRRCDITVEQDKNVESLIKAGTETVVIFGKTWDFHVTDIIQTTLDENLRMIYDTINYFKKHGKEVFFDAEHFYDGYLKNSQYAMLCLEVAKEAGVDSIILCDTNGGTFPNEIYDITQGIAKRFPIEIGVHCHNDCGMAVSNSIMGVLAGARQVQGTFLGFGERCGNANLSAIIPCLQLKKSIKCIPKEQISNLTSTARLIAEVSNISMQDNMPFVGKAAFAHKGGMHIDGVSKSSTSFEHIEPKSVGNERRFLTSEVAGRSTILSKIQTIDPNITKDSHETQRIINHLKHLEHEGYQFEAAEETFELIIRKQLGKYKPFFELLSFKIIGERPYLDGRSASALIKILVDGKVEITAAEGNGPVNALDKALRKALEVFYPVLSKVHLVDYKVRVLDGTSATAAKVRVLIESTDGLNNWSTVGVSKDIIEASWIALVDSIEYKLISEQEKSKRGE